MRMSYCRYRECQSFGFRGCWGSMICANWFWDNFPAAYAGQRNGKEKKPNIRMEVVPDDYLYLLDDLWGARCEE